jgi:hypothetical protein
MNFSRLLRRFATALVIGLGVLGVGGAWQALTATTARTAAPGIDCRDTAGSPLASVADQAGLIVTLTGQDTEFEKLAMAELMIRNRGDRPLEFSLERLSCECVQRVTLDSAALIPRQPATLGAETAPKLLRIAWVVHRKDVSAEQSQKLGRIWVLLRTNDPVHPHVRLEITTRLREVSPEQTLR